MITRILRYSSVGMATMALGLGVAAASSVTIDRTGPDSHVKVEQEGTNKATVNNDNDLRASNNNTQSATTGSAKVHYNTTGGDAMSGSAMNDGTFSTMATVDNSGSLGSMGNFFGAGASHDASVSNTGPGSHVTIEQTTKNTLTLNNDNSINVSNNNTQTAKSGYAEVSNNTTGGNATSGDSSNTASFTTEISVTN